MMRRRAFLASLLATPAAHALGRVPYGGTLSLELPFALDTLDPHEADDAAGALFSAAIADPLFAWDPSGRAYPALASKLPEPFGPGARVTLREGLVTAHGRSLDARDVIASLARARSRAAGPLFASFGNPERVPGDLLSVFIPGASPDALAFALASPCTAILPRTFTPEEPDATGAFRVTRVKAGLDFTRNDRAARGPSFLERLRVRRAGDLAETLRAFEVGDADVGFLGSGLHRRRADAVDFRATVLGFVILRTGPLAGPWGAPGIAGRLVGAVDPARLAHLGLGEHGAPGAAVQWGGPPSELLVQEGSPYLSEVANVLASVFSAPGHELRPVPLPQAEMRRRTQGGKFAVAVQVLRVLGPTRRHALLSLLGAADPRLAEHPPSFSESQTVDLLTRTLPLAVLGEFRVAGARVAELHGLEDWDLGAVFRA
jgi:peptide/nickel transport system substrate-binding protein